MAAQYNPTSLSAGIAIRGVLMATEGIAGKVTRIFPVLAQKATLPYICFHREGVEVLPDKGLPAPDHTTVEVECYTADYDSGVELAERVRAALDGAQWEGGGITLRRCYYRDSREDWANDAYVQVLAFEVSVG